MKQLNTYITEYIIKKKLDHPIDSSVTDVYEEIDDLIDLDNYDNFDYTIYNSTYDELKEEVINILSEVDL